MSWTPERVESLRKLWDEGLSASQVARILGGVTRNGVIGKIHRLGLAGRAVPHRERATPTRARPYRPFVETAQAMPAAPIKEPEPALDENGARITIETVRALQCRWPHGDPQLPTFHLCGGATLSGSVYCLPHARKAYSAGAIRARRDEAAEELAEIAKRERIFA